MQNDQNKMIALNSAAITCAGRPITPEQVLLFAEEFKKWLDEKDSEKV